MTDLGPRGDAIVQADWCVGEILQTLDRLHLSENTLVLLSSDNGPVIDDGYQDDAVTKLGDHRPSGPLRGGKYSKFEAGTRVPFIVRWPARVKPGVSEAIVSQVDFPASFAELTGQSLAPNDAPDSLNILSRPPRRNPRTAVMTSSFMATAWPCAQAIGSTSSPEKVLKVSENTHTEMGNDPGPQLYDLRSGSWRNPQPCGPTSRARPADAGAVG